jgi:hypothetical protein
MIVPVPVLALNKANRFSNFIKLIVLEVIRENSETQKLPGLLILIELLLPPRNEEGWACRV